ncbi:MAG: hypothetical protein GX663_01330 [Clostridiales bacterium]|nr:hypothetical protein [Clostridiales bacterium]
MKKALSIFILAVLCFSMTACGVATISGDPVSYSNASKSFSIDLPTKEKGDWVKNKDVSRDVLDISDANDYINIQIQCLTRSQATYIATDLATYQDYTMTNTLGELAPDMELKDAKVKVPKFATNSSTQSFTMKKGSSKIKGNLIFMESASSYYAVMVMAIDESYDRNKSALMDAILSMKEITEAN